MIEVRNLGKRFGEVVAVDDVSFAARDGQVTGLLGPNGAGKTTTLRVLYGLLRADQGDVLVDDVNVTAAPQEAQRRMGVLPDSRGLYVRLTAREHLRYYGRLHGLSASLVEERIERLASLLMHERAARREAQEALARAAAQVPPSAGEKGRVRVV